MRKGETAVGSAYSDDAVESLAILYDTALEYGDDAKSVYLLIDRMDVKAAEQFARGLALNYQLLADRLEALTKAASPECDS